MIKTRGELSAGLQHTFLQEGFKHGGGGSPLLCLQQQQSEQRQGLLQRRRLLVAGYCAWKDKGQPRFCMQIFYGGVRVWRETVFIIDGEACELTASVLPRLAATVPLLNGALQFLTRKYLSLCKC